MPDKLGTELHADDRRDVLNAYVYRMTKESPEEAVKAILAHAQRMREDAAELDSSWQDKHAGDVWRHLADGLERAANGTIRKWSMRF